MPTTPSRTVVFTNAVEGAERAAGTPLRSALTGCPWRDVKSMLRDVGLRPTRQRMALGWILFGKGDRHVTAEMLYEEATKAKVPVSLATVYNALNQFTRAGLLREVAIEGDRTYFDTNTSNHFHYYIEAEDRLFDIETSELSVRGLPEPPPGTKVARIDVIVRLRRDS